jgi:hypothetical protein
LPDYPSKIGSKSGRTCGTLLPIMATKKKWQGRAFKKPAHISVESGAVYVVPFSFIRSYLSHEIEDESFYRSGCRPIVLFPRVEAGEASKEWFETLLGEMEELHRRHPRERLETPGVSPVGGGVDVGLIDIPVTFRGPLGLVTSNLKRRPMELFEENLRHVDALFAGTFHDQMTLVSVLHVFQPGGARQIHYHNLVFGVRREFRDGRVLVGPLDLKPMLDALTSELQLGVVGLG